MSNKEKLNFWIGMAIDHCVFLISALSSLETNYINEVKSFQEEFINFKQKEENLQIDEIINTLNQFIEFKKLILAQIINNNIDLNLPPTMINHMINEEEEFYKELQKIKYGIKENPLVEIISDHKLWLPDTAGHAAIIASRLDPVETDEIKLAKNYEVLFHNLHNKVNELNQILLRTNFDADNLRYFNKQVIYEVTEFIDFLHEIESLKSQNKILNYMYPNLLDHYIKEGEYYLAKIMSFK